MDEDATVEKIQIEVAGHETSHNVEDVEEFTIYTVKLMVFFKGKAPPHQRYNRVFVVKQRFSVLRELHLELTFALKSRSQETVPKFPKRHRVATVLSYKTLLPKRMAKMQRYFNELSEKFGETLLEVDSFNSFFDVNGNVTKSERSMTSRTLPPKRARVAANKGGKASGLLAGNHRSIYIPKSATGKSPFSYPDLPPPWTLPPPPPPPGQEESAGESKEKELKKSSEKSKRKKSVHSVQFHPPPEYLAPAPPTPRQEEGEEAEKREKTEEKAREETGEEGKDQSQSAEGGVAKTDEEEKKEEEKEEIEEEHEKVNALEKEGETKEDKVVSVEEIAGNDVEEKEETAIEAQEAKKEDTTHEKTVDKAAEEFKDEEGKVEATVEEQQEKKAVTDEKPDHAIREEVHDKEDVSTEVEEKIEEKVEAAEEEAAEVEDNVEEKKEETEGEKDEEKEEEKVEETVAEKLEEKLEQKVEEKAEEKEEKTADKLVEKKAEEKEKAEQEVVQLATQAETQDESADSASTSKYSTRTEVRHTLLAIDMGSSEVRARREDTGFSAEMEAVVGVPKKGGGGGMFPGSDRTYVGKEALAPSRRYQLQVERPRKKGHFVSSFSCAERLLQHIAFLQNDFGQTTEAPEILAVAVDLPNRDDLRALCQWLHEDWSHQHVVGYERFCVIPQQVAVLSSLGIATGVVVHIGEDHASVCVVYEGSVMEHTVQEVSVTGQLLTEHIRSTMSGEDLFFEIFQERVSEVHQERVAREFKEKYCHCEKAEAKDTLPTHFGNHYSAVMSKRRTFWAMAAFAPDTVGVIGKPLEQCVADAVGLAPKEIREELWKNIVTTGGGTRFAGFADELLHKLKLMSSCTDFVRVTPAPPDASITGLSALAHAYGEAFERWCLPTELDSEEIRREPWRYFW